VKLPAAREQAEVLSEFAREHELELIPEFLAEAASNFEGGYEVGKRLLSLQGRPTAVLVGSEELAFGLCHAFRDGGLELPRDMSVVAVGDSTLARSFVPPLTTISIPHEEMAAAALGALWMMCRSSETAESQTFSTKLVERGSTARPSRAPVTLKKFDRERLRHLS
jgi:DNA-binding LacI/PurR family transcriptional regulator